MKESKTITFGDILDLIDKNRESDEIVELETINGDNNAISGPMCSTLWKPLEGLRVDSIESTERGLLVWVKEAQDDDK